MGNIAQIRVGIRENLVAGSNTNANEPNDPYWGNTELLKCINWAVLKLYRIITAQHEDFFLRQIASGDASILLLGESYSPSSLEIAAGTVLYTLPPDFVRAKLWVVTQASYEGTRIWFTDMTQEAFRSLFASVDRRDSRDFFADVIGRRSVRINPVPDVTLATRLFYIYRPRRLREYSTGTVAVTADSATVTGTGTNWTYSIVAGDELILSTTSTAPTPDPTVQYLPIKSVDSATQVTLESPFRGTTASGLAYIAAGVPEVEPEFHDIVEAFATARAFAKGSSPNLERVRAWDALARADLPDLLSLVAKRQIQDSEFVEAYMEDDSSSYGVG